MKHSHVESSGLNQGEAGYSMGSYELAMLHPRPRAQLVTGSYLLPQLC